MGANTSPLCISQPYLFFLFQERIERVNSHFLHQRPHHVLHHVHYKIGYLSHSYVLYKDREPYNCRIGFCSDFVLSDIEDHYDCLFSSRSCYGKIAFRIKLVQFSIQKQIQNTFKYKINGTLILHLLKNDLY